MAGQLAVLLFPLFVIVAGAGDVMTRRIPNRLVIFVAAGFIPLAISVGMPVWMVGLHFATAIVLLAGGFTLFSFGYIGGGDAKLMAAAGLWLGFPVVLPFLLFSAVAGGLLAAAIGLWFMAHLEAGIRSKRADRLLAELKPDVPYGFALAAGAILATPFSWMMGPAGG